MPTRNLVLIGFMGTGKSTVGKRCAARLGYTFRDTDAVIEERAGAPVSQIFTERGEAAFRQLERDAIAELAATPQLVIATGGGAILDPDNAARLRETGLIVLLTATPEIILRRVGDGRTRPLLAPNPRERVLQLLAERLPRYEEAAQHQVDTTDRRIEDIVTEVIGLLTSSGV